MVETNKTLTNYYFKKFTFINLIVLFILVFTRFVLSQEFHIFLVYFFMLFGLAVYARINFELLRPYAGIGATLYIFWVLRIVLIYMLTHKIGVCTYIDEETLRIYYEFLANNHLIEFVNVLGSLAIFFLIFDMYIGVKKIQENSASAQ